VQPDHQFTYRDVFAVREFRVLWFADALSVLGDQLARVALAILVFERTGSALLTALTYALSFLPWLLGPLLAGLADRHCRRDVMIVCDLARAALVALMAVPSVPFPVLCVLLFSAELLAGPFAAARAATLPDILPDDRYVLASAVTNITNQSGQVIGFAAGGALVAVVGTSQALAFDAATFALSAVLIRFGIRRRPIAPIGEGEVSPGSLVTGLKQGARLVFGDARLRALVGLAWLCAFYIVPEALAAPYAAHLDGGNLLVGILMAANPLGTVVGAVVVSRLLAPAVRLQLMGPLAVLSCVPLVATVLDPPAAVVVAILFLSGVGGSYNLPANAAFVAAVPGARRGQAFGLVQSGILLVQGLAILAAGALAELFPLHLVVAGAGMLGTLAALALLSPAREAGRALAPRPFAATSAASDAPKSSTSV